MALCFKEGDEEEEEEEERQEPGLFGMRGLCGLLSPMVIFRRTLSSFKHLSPNNAIWAGSISRNV